jgi:hypothetical protein
MTTMSQRTEGATIRFDATLFAIDTSTMLRLPETASRLRRYSASAAADRPVYLELRASTNQIDGPVEHHLTASAPDHGHLRDDAIQTGLPCRNQSRGVTRRDGSRRESDRVARRGEDDA